MPDDVIPAAEAGEFAFDALAERYDATFSDVVPGSLMRRAVWRRLDACFDAGDRLLELGCGTGLDAVHLAGRGASVLALDRSPEMLTRARERVAAAGLEARIELRCGTIEELPAVLARRPAPSTETGKKSTSGRLAPPFDGALANFGVLNCVADLPALGRQLAALLSPGAPLVICLMGPLVPWEWLWFLARGRPATALRRLRPGGVAWRGLTVRYPSPGSARRAFEPAFYSRRLAAVGALVPPTYAAAWAARHRRWVERLDRLERRLEQRWPLPWLADHYLLELERRSG